MTFEAKTKDPDASLDFAFNLAKEWLREGEAISSYTVTAVGVNVDSHSQSDGIITVWISGGKIGETALVTCRITTDNVPPRIDERTAPINIVRR